MFERSCVRLRTSSECRLRAADELQYGQTVFTSLPPLYVVDPVDLCLASAEAEEQSSESGRQLQSGGYGYE